MREFIIYSNKGVTTSDFHIKDLPGSGGRMDLMARSIISALWLSHDMRRNTKIYINLNGEPEPPITVTFNGKNLRKASPNEREIGIWIKKALKRKKDLKNEEWLETHSGIQISRKSFEDLIEKRRNKNIYILKEDGEDIRKKDVKEDSVYILGDNVGLPERVTEYLNDYETQKISLGPNSYFTTQSITLIQNELDRKKVG